MKKIVSLMLALIMCMVLCVPTFATNEGEETSSHSVDADVINYIQEKLNVAKTEAIGDVYSGTPSAFYDVETLKEMLADVLVELREAKTDENSSFDNRIEELENQKDELETQLAMQDVLVLTDDDLKMIFKDTQFVLYRGEGDNEPGISTASSVTAVTIPVSTTYNLWTYSGLKTNYEYPCYYVEAKPLGERSSLHNYRDEESITKPWGPLAGGVVNFFVSKAIGAVGTKIDRVNLATAFNVAITSDSTPTKYSYEFEESLTVRCVYVYTASQDEYRCTLITHSDKIVYSHRAFEQGWKSHTLSPAKGLYFDNPYSQAIARYKSGNYLTQIDHQLNFYADIKINNSDERLVRFTPIYINVISDVYDT